ncbi:hypothetical protein PR048_017048, partial [Dryococelus australis]
MNKSSVSSKIKWQVIGMFKYNKNQREIASVLNPNTGRAVRVTIDVVVVDRRQRHLGTTVPLQDSPNRIGIHLCQCQQFRYLVDCVCPEKNRQNWCHQMRNWVMERWGKVLFSDECRFELYSRRRIRVRRTPTKKFHPECLSSAVQQGGGSIMAWGCISMQGQTSLGLLTVLWILKNTLKQRKMPCFLLHTNFMEDIMCFGKTILLACRRSSLTIQWFEEDDIPLLQGPAQSPDLNPIENVWNYIGAKLAAPRPKNIHKLRTKIHDRNNL